MAYQRFIDACIGPTSGSQSDRSSWLQRLDKKWLFVVECKFMSGSVIVWRIDVDLGFTSYHSSVFRYNFTGGNGNRFSKFKMVAAAILNLVNMHFWYDSCVLCQILNILIKFGEDWSNSKEMASHFRNERWRRPPSLILVSMHFWSDGRVLRQIFKIPIKFGEDWCDSKEMATDFRNSRWRRQSSWKRHFRLNRQYEKKTPRL